MHELITWYTVDTAVPQLPTDAHVLVELDDHTMVSGNFVGEEIIAHGEPAQSFSDYYFAPDIHGSREYELAAEVDIEYVLRWTFYPEGEVNA